MTTKVKSSQMDFNSLALVADHVSVDTGGLFINGTAVTSTAAELNALDGVTSTVAELNILDGVTAVAAELNYLDITTLGTGAASKAVVLDTGDDYTWPAAGILTYGVLKDSAGTTLGATAAEINMAADESANTEVVTTTNVLTAAESGKTLILNSATAFVTTLPAVAAGLRFTFYAGATQVTGGNHTIVPNAANDNTIYGEYLVAGATVPASAEGSINWVADTILPGDKVEVFCDGTNWYVSGAAAATGAITFTT